jgi:hypothetical protein
MAQTIKIKNSSVALKVPVVGDLAYGEIALNYADGKIYYKKSDNTVQSISGGGGGTWTKISTTLNPAIAGKQYLVDTTAAAFTVTLPASPVAGDYVYFMDAGNWVTNNLTVARNGKTIEGVADDLLLNLKGVLVQLIYDGTTWQLACNIGPQGAQGPAGSGGGGTTTNALTVGTGLVLNSGTTFDGSAAKTISLATSGVSAGTYGDNYYNSGYIYMPIITIDTYGRITGVTSNYVGLGGAPELPNQTGNSGKYLTTNGSTVSWAVVAAAAGGGSGWYSMVATSMGTTSLPLPSDYDGSGSNYAPTKLFVGGEDSFNSSGSSPGGTWNSYAVSGSFNVYTYTSGTPQSGAMSISTGSGGVRFAIAPKSTMTQMATVFYTPSSNYNAVFNLSNGWSGPPSYNSSKVWYGIVVLDSAGVTATAVNCTIVETKSSSSKTYIAISMTDAQCSTVSNTYANVCTFSGTYTFRVFGFYRYG